MTKNNIIEEFDILINTIYDEIKCIESQDIDNMVEIYLENNKSTKNSTKEVIEFYLIRNKKDLISKIENERSNFEKLYELNKKNETALIELDRLIEGKIKTFSLMHQANNQLFKFNFER